MKKIVFSALTLLAFSTFSFAKSSSNSIPVHAMNKVNDGTKADYALCLVSIILVDENNQNIGEVYYWVENPQNFIECLNRGIAEANNLKAQGIATGKVAVLGMYQ